VGAARVIARLSAHEGDLVADSIVLGELCLGVLALPKGAKRARLEAWFEAPAQNLECLPWDAAVSRRWARLVAKLRSRGLAIPLLDGMIAATALEHDLTVATRNVRDFQRSGVRRLDPFA
jgi:toxin FitB